MSSSEQGALGSLTEEEQYFFEKNQELLKQKREKLDEERKAAAADHSTKSYWLVCPKCGTKMEEINHHGIMLDKCGGCKGLYFDNGELDTLINSTGRRGFFNSIRKLF